MHQTEPLRDRILLNSAAVKPNPVQFKQSEMHLQLTHLVISVAV